MPLVEDENRYIPGEEKYWLAFRRVRGLGLVRLRALFDHFGSMQAAWEARSGDLLAAGLEPKYTERLLNFRPTFDPDVELTRLAQLGIQLLVLDGPGYPARLAQIDDPPAVLYLKGSLEEADTLALAVVGTRQATSYGKQATREICSNLAGQGVTVVSGLARGIDTIAHQATIEAGGRTLAVLGSGLDVIYPHENRALAAQVIQHGALISEYPPGTQPDAINFPARNRIVSGLSCGVLVVESAVKGGALITADFAREQGREVFALPGSIYNPSSAGTNQMVRKGEATLITSAADIMEELRPGRMWDSEDHQMRFELAEAGDNAVEQNIVQVLRQAGQPLHIDEVCRELALPMSEVSGVLVLMEIKGSVQSMGGMRYGLTRLSL